MSSNVNVVRGDGKLQHVVQVDSHRLIADAPSQYGGEDAGFTPHDLLAASLGACTALTLNMYAQRKGFPLQKVEVEVEHADMDGTRSEARRGGKEWVSTCKSRG